MMKRFLSATLIVSSMAGATGSALAQDQETDAPEAVPTGRLLFSRFDESSHTFLSAHLIAPDGSGEVEVPMPGPEGGGRWSHDGELIAVMTVLDDGRIGTAIIRADGTVERILTPPDATLNAVCTVWWPDDSRLACEAWDDNDPSRNGIYAVRADDGGELTRLTTPPAGMVDLPGDVSPDGTKLVFKRTSEEDAGPLMVVDEAGGKPQALGERVFEDPGRFSRDGTSVLTSSAGTIKQVALDGTDQHSIDDPGAFLFGPVWSPDGEWIAYSRATSGPFADLYVSRLDGTDQRQVTDTPANEIRVEWGSSSG